MVIGLEVHCELADGHQALLRLPQRVRRRAQHQHLPDLPGPARARCRCSTSRPSSWPCASAPRCTARSGRRSSTGRTTSTRTRPRTTRSASTTSRSTSTATSSCPTGSGSGIERAHMEEDTGKTDPRRRESGRIHGADYSLVDYNRSGVPARRDRERARHAHRRPGPGLRHRAAGASSWPSGASDGKMEEGSMRVDANVSVRRSADEPFGTRCEIKNLNSLRSLGRAIEYEAARQIALLEAGERVVQETRHWDEDGRAHRGAALQGGGLRLPLLPRARPGPAGARRRVDPSGGRHPRARCRPTRRARLVDLLGGRGEATDAELRPGGHGGRPRPRRPGGRGGRRRGRRPRWPSPGRPTRPPPTPRRPGASTRGRTSRC